MKRLPLLLLVAWPVWGEVYQDPQGKFQAPVPAGWKASLIGEAVGISKGGAYVIITAAGGGSPEEFIGRLVKQTGAQWSKLQELKRGNSTVGGQQATYVFFSGVNPRGVPSFLKITALGAGGKVFTLVGASPEKDFPALKPEMDQIEAGFALTAGGGGGGGQAYRDPGGRFTVSAPNGWQANPTDQGVYLVGGNAYVLVQAAGPGGAEQIAQGVGRQWKNFRQVKQEANAVYYAGVNPKGVPAVLKVATVGTFVLMMSAPEAEFGGAAGAFQQIEQSFQAGGGGGGVGGGTPKVQAPAAGPAYLGLAVRELESGEARAFGVQESQGVFVGQVAPGGPGAKAGIQRGDIILSANGRALRKTPDLPGIVAQGRPGDVLQLVVVRQGRPSVVRVTLEARP